MKSKYILRAYDYSQKLSFELRKNNEQDLFVQMEKEFAQKNDIREYEIYKKEKDGCVTLCTYKVHKIDEKLIYNPHNPTIDEPLPERDSTDKIITLEKIVKFTKEQVETLKKL